ncbi:MAG: Zn-dependent hydrolase [Solirubrobacterales bacterium]|nr:Zn-dependent hydrolase [Solirubrobacterales bacterium]
MADHEWFHVQALAPGVWQLTEPGHVCTWLVAGTERAVLIDTGCGFVPIRPLVQALTALPVTVVNTHHHVDHVGGDHEFDEVLIHEAGVAGLAAGVAAKHLTGYREYALAQEEAAAAYAQLDARFFHLQRDEHRPRPLPACVRDGTWAIEPVAATGTIADGDVIDLGGRTLRALHTPGHSPADVSLELVGEGLLFGGDTVNTGPVYVQNPDSSVPQLRASLALLAARSQDWRRVFCSHFMRTAVPPSYLHAQVAALDELLAGTVARTPAVDCVGTAVDEASFDGFSFFLPLGWLPPATNETH